MKDENGLTVAKLIPNTDSVFVGVREGYPPLANPEVWSGTTELLSRRVRNVSFLGVNARTVEDPKRFIQAIRCRMDPATLPAENSGEPEV